VLPHRSRRWRGLLVHLPDLHAGPRSERAPVNLPSAFTAVALGAGFGTGATLAVWTIHATRTFLDRVLFGRRGEDDTVCEECGLDLVCPSCVAPAPPKAEP
jgi:hypothetical protein